ncbi:MAG: hypothetical protein LBH52_02305 [Puniceicoccales bacterium]|jgi:hypothetical protein|nr:hypothetical protein [Puniceicoccales bacterium]
MNHYYLLNTRQLDLRFLDLEKSPLGYTLNTNESVFESQPSTKQWLKVLEATLEKLLRSHKILGPVGFILPEHLVINIVVRLPSLKSRFSVIQQLTGALNKDFGLRGDKIVFRFQQMPYDEDFKAYWVALIPKKFWIILKHILHLHKKYFPYSINCFPPIVGQAAYLEEMGHEKLFQSPAVGIFLEDNLTRFFTSIPESSVGDQPAFNFLDLRKVSSANSVEQDVVKELNVTSRYFSRSLNLQAGVKTIFIFGEGNASELESPLLAFGENVHVIKEIHQWCESDKKKVGLSEQALLVGILHILSGNRHFDDFDFMEMDSPSSLMVISWFYIRKIVHHVALRWLILLLLIGYFFFLLGICKKEANVCDNLRHQCMAYTLKENDVQDLKQQLVYWELLKGKQVVHTQLLQTIKRQFTSLKLDLCIDAIQISSSEKLELEVKGRYKNLVSAAEFSRTLKEGCHLSFSTMEKNVQISTTPLTYTENSFVCKFPL